MSPLCLHLGCGNTHIPGFLNMDIKKTFATDIEGDIRFLTGFDNNSVDLIYACNVIEHFGKLEFPGVFKKWYSILKPKGILRLSTPNLEAVFKYYEKTKDLEGCYSTLYGGQKNEFSFHKWGWDYKILKKNLETVGFKNVHRYDRSKTEHASVQDWSLNFLPQYDRKGHLIYYGKWIKGINIALNVECNK